ncbi:MAG TPA: sensor histidine kinase [Thiopseudomonas sp.]|nr:sensor histidine kinase [Thiopseudomonas sp.]
MMRLSVYKSVGRPCLHHLVSQPLMTLLKALFTLTTLLFLLGVSSCALAEPLSIGEDIPYTLLVDAQGELTFEQAQQRLRNSVASEQATLSRGYTRDTFWLKFELTAKQLHEKERWLEFGPNFVDDIQLFFREKDSSQNWLSRQTGDLLHSVSDLDYRNPVFILPVLSADTQGYEVIVRVRSSSTVILAMTLWAPEEFLGYAARSTSFWSFYFGLATLSSLLALVLALILRTHLLWTATAFSAAYVFVASVQGYVNWIFPSTAIPLQHYATSTLLLISFAVLIWMSSETINLRTHLPWAHKILMASCAVTLSLLVLVPLDLYNIAIYIKTVILLLTYSLFIYSVFHIWVRDRFSLSTLGLGISPMLCMVASLFGIFSAFGWIPFNQKVYVIWQYALVENMLLVLAISVYRIRKRRVEEFERHKLLSDLAAEREASFNQRQFMGTVSHEFRTPLAIISAALENLQLAESEIDSPRLARYQKVERATERLIQLTDNCLADARLSAGSAALYLEAADVMQLISSAASLVHLSDSHKLRVTVNGQSALVEGLQCQVLVDAAMMRIAMSNVIDNAVKYSTGGVIHIDCRVADASVAVLICDQGSGLGDLDPDMIFQRYRRGDSSKHGTGLGLFVAQQIAVASGGGLKLVSSTAQGSCFEFTLKRVIEG